MAEPRSRALLLIVFATMALALAVIGVYGVIGYVVGQRTREIGVRMALGARAGHVLKMVLSQGMKPVVIRPGGRPRRGGRLSRLLSGLLFEVTPVDPGTYLSVAGLLLLAYWRLSPPLFAPRGWIRLPLCVWSKRKKRHPQRCSANQRTIATAERIRFGSLRNPWPSSGKRMYSTATPRFFNEPTT